MDVVSTDLGVLYDAIVGSIALQFPGIRTVRDHVSTRDKITTPAVLVDMVEMEAGDSDPGTEQIALDATFEARIIIGFRTEKAKREIRKLAAALSSHIHMQRWGQPCGAAQVIVAEPDAFDPDLDRYEVYRIEWRQPILIGTNVWINDGQIPTTVLGSFDPDIGADHKDDYVVIAGEGHG